MTDVKGRMAVGKIMNKFHLAIATGCLALMHRFREVSSLHLDRETGCTDCCYNFHSSLRTNREDYIEKDLNLFFHTFYNTTFKIVA